VSPTDPRPPIRSQRRRARARRRGGPGRVVLWALLLILGTGVIALGFAVRDVAAHLPNLKDLKEVPLGQNTRIFDSTGKLLGYIAGDTNRTVVRWQQIPKTLADATVAIEDKRFYEHNGVDYRRIVGAFFHNLVSGTTQGGSTITMQLVKNLYDPTAGRTFGQKIEEAYLAEQVEKQYTKQQILTSYLNGVFYGNNAVGVQAAALTYFNKPVWQITLPQAALIAGLPQAPTSYSPFLHPRLARDRRNEVLEQMARQGYITRDLAERAKGAGLGLAKERGRVYQRVREGYFFDYVRNLLIQKYGRREVQRGGFRVYTTIDPKLQTAAEAAIRGRLYQEGDPASALVMVDTRTGFIRAMATSQTYGQDSQFNYAAQGQRQAGSTFKTFVLTQAVEEGINPYTTFYESKRLLYDDRKWGPIDVQTYSHSYRGVIPVATATLASDNTVYSQLTMDVRPDQVAKTMHAMGITSPLDPFPAIGLGASPHGVTPLEMAVAYAPLSNGGMRVAPIAISKIVRPDGTVDRVAPKKKRVFSDGVAYEVTRILRANVTGGTGTAANIGVPAAGKTGTTDDYTDAWFVGYTPQFSTAVWVGYPNDQGVARSMNSVHGITVAGGTFPAQIWHDFMGVAVKPFGAQEFKLPQHPVSWSPFSSDFTRAAAAAKAAAASSSAAAASAAAASSVAAGASTRAGTPTLGNGGESPRGNRPAPDTGAPALPAPDAPPTAGGAAPPPPAPTPETGAAAPPAPTVPAGTSP
jgi:penicillin-binding protein 1A